MKISQDMHTHMYRYATRHHCAQGRCVSPRTVIWKPSHIPIRQLIFIISQDSLNMQDDRDEGHYRAE